MKITNKQLGFISAFLRHYHQDELADYEAKTTKGMPFNAPLLGAERWIKDNIEYTTAWDIIGMVQDDKADLAYKQLIHLGLPTKRYEQQTK